MKKIYPVIIVSIILLIAFFILYTFNKPTTSTMNMQNIIQDTTWNKDNNWAGEGYVFYIDDSKQMKCMHQTYGSGVYVTQSEYCRISILDTQNIKINDEVYNYQDNKLVSKNTTLVLKEKRPLVYGKAGLVDMQIVRNPNFKIEDLGK